MRQLPARCLGDVLQGEVTQTNILVRIPDRFAKSVVLAHQATLARAGGTDASAIPSDETIHSLFAASIEVMIASRFNRSCNPCPAVAANTTSIAMVP